MSDKDTLSLLMPMRISKADNDRLVSLVDRIPVASRNAIARYAFRLGLEFLEKDPTRIVNQKPPIKHKRIAHQRVKVK